MDRVMPTIEDLQEKLSSRYTGDYGDDYDFYTVQYVQAQAMLIIALELGQLNNNLEALRGDDARH